MNQEDNKVVEAVVETPVEKTELELALERAEKAEKDRDNYKNVALQRLGKLPGDAEFLNKGESTELPVAEQVRLALLDREVEKSQEEVKAANNRLIKENSELRLALKNRPGSSIGGDSGGSSVSVKDNVFSEAQLAELTKRAVRLKIDPVQYIARMKENLQKKG